MVTEVDKYIALIEQDIDAAQDVVDALKERRAGFIKRNHLEAGHETEVAMTLDDRIAAVEAEIKSILDQHLSAARRLDALVREKARALCRLCGGEGIVKLLGLSSYSTCPRCNGTGKEPRP